MAIRTDEGTGGMTEQCDVCGTETLHDVSIQLRTESRQAENAAFSREPYRLSTCRICGTETSLRMNNA